MLKKIIELQTIKNENADLKPDTHPIDILFNKEGRVVEI